MPSPFFTVITVTYNSSQFVRDAIESVLASTFTDFELIIGDDCSTDNTWEIINEYDDSRIVKYRNETNLREYPNRNKALNLARGEWVIFIDGDDLIFEHGLQIFHHYLIKFPNVKMLIQKEYTNNVIYPVLMTNLEYLRNEYFDSKRLSCSSFASNVFKLDALKDSGLLPVNHKSGDEFVRLKLGIKHGSLFISSLNTWPRETPGQASSFIKANEALHELIGRTLICLEEFPELNEYREAILSTLKNNVLFCIKYYTKRLRLKTILEIIYTQRHILIKPSINKCNLVFLDNFSSASPLKN
jgi:glycosyltransferase involved in cell wall biosynthesis